MTTEALAACPMCTLSDEHGPLLGRIGGWPAHLDCAELHAFGLTAPRPDPRLIATFLR